MRSALELSLQLLDEAVVCGERLQEHTRRIARARQCRGHDRAHAHAPGGYLYDRSI